MQAESLPRHVLAVAEQSDLVRLESVIEKGKETFVEVGTALCRIRDERLYRATHGSFQCYCEERWNFSRVQAHRLIEAANVVKVLPIGNTITTESQARELAKVPEAKRVEVLEVAKASGHPITAKTIKAASVELAMKLSPEAKLRWDGATIIEKIQGLDHDITAIEKWLSGSLGRICTPEERKEKQENNDLLQRARSELIRIRNTEAAEIEQAMRERAEIIVRCLITAIDCVDRNLELDPKEVNEWLVQNGPHWKQSTSFFKGDFDGALDGTIKLLSGIRTVRNKDRVASIVQRGQQIVGAATIIQHCSVSGRLITPVRSYEIGNPEPCAQHPVSVCVTFIEQRKRRPARVVMHPTSIRYLTIEALGQTVYDSRQDVPCNMEQWAATDAERAKRIKAAPERAAA